ncbi:MAG: NAD(P)-dependent alcohol dehydrogenase [Pseudomonadota bacterium]
MLDTLGYAVDSATSPFKPFKFQRRDVGPHDVLIKILYCGVCHSDIHTARNEWKGTVYPLVPGHEIVGKVMQVGAEVKKFKVDDIAGVGCFVDSCRTCDSCKEGEEQFCEQGGSFTYNSFEQDKKTRTFGGYSSQIVVDEKYVLKISAKLPLEKVAPLLCAGITTYSPLKRFNVGKDHKVGVIGLGGLGHMAVKLAAAMGAEVTVFSTSPGKEKDALRLGAKHFAVTKNPENLQALANQFDLIIDTVSAPHDCNMYLNLLNRGGTLVIVGVPEKPFELQPFNLIMCRRQLAGSLIGGMRETQEMLDYCAEHNITSDVEMIPITKLAEAYERTIKSDVHYRFVIDMNSLA